MKLFTTILLFNLCIINLHIQLMTALFIPVEEIAGFAKSIPAVARGIVKYIRHVGKGTAGAKVATPGVTRAPAVIPKSAAGAAGRTLERSKSAPAFLGAKAPIKTIQPTNGGMGSLTRSASSVSKSSARIEPKALSNVAPEGASKFRLDYFGTGGPDAARTNSAGALKTTKEFGKQIAVTGMVQGPFIAAPYIPNKPIVIEG